jgi:hypothetical protein
VDLSTPQATWESESLHQGHGPFSSSRLPPIEPSSWDTKLSLCVSTYGAEASCWLCHLIPELDTPWSFPQQSEHPWVVLPSRAVGPAIF